MFVHRKGEELWIAWTSFPTEDTNYFLDVGSRKGLKGATDQFPSIVTFLHFSNLAFLTQLSEFNEFPKTVMLEHFALSVNSFDQLVKIKLPI